MRRGCWARASSTFARSGTRRRCRCDFLQGFSRPCEKTRSIEATPLSIFAPLQRQGFLGSHPRPDEEDGERPVLHTQLGCDGFDFLPRNEGLNLSVLFEPHLAVPDPVSRIRVQIAPGDTLLQDRTKRREKLMAGTSGKRATRLTRACAGCPGVGLQTHASRARVDT
jgi:hypothetical protein